VLGARLPARAVLVLGGESAGLSVRTDRELSIPMFNQVESLNVAAAAAVAAFAVSAAIAR
jgi:23S rRNA (guanosine2251-2'-O)-methyltransferase